MAYTLLVGNNFISNSPRNIKYNDRLLFKLKQVDDTQIPSISIIIVDDENNRTVEVEENILKYCSPELTKKKTDPGHIFIVNRDGEIVFESRVLDKKTILVSGIFYIDTLKLTITQNYIILPSEKWIMHDKVNSNNGDVIITNDGIKVSS